MWDLIVSVPDHCLSFYFVSHISEDRFSHAMAQIKLELNF